MKIGEKTRKLRSQAGMSYSALSAAVGCSEGALRQLESGQIASPRVRLCSALANVLRVSLDWLADESADWPPPASDQQKAEGLVREALTRGGLAGDLSADERNLLAAWRHLPEGQRRQALGYVVGLACAASEPVTDEQMPVTSGETDRMVDDALRTGRSAKRRSKDAG